MFYSKRKWSQANHRYYFVKSWFKFAPASGKLKDIQMKWILLHLHCKVVVYCDTKILPVGSVTNLMICDNTSMVVLYNWIWYYSCTSIPCGYKECSNKQIVANTYNIHETFWNYLCEFWNNMVSHYLWLLILLIFRCWNF